MNVYQIITNNIIEEIEKSGELFWQKTWKMKAPANLITKAFYRGINRILLKTGDYWLTFNQAKQKGLNIKKGAKSKIAIFYSVVEKNDKEEIKGSEEDLKESYRVLKYYHVFNENAVDGDLSKFIPQQEQEPVNPDEEDKNIEKTLLDYIAKFGINLEHGGNSASFYFNQNIITMPPKERFISYRDYLCSLAHEAGHSTAKTLNRKIENNEFGDVNYSFEELVAEFTALFIAGKGKIKDNTTAYLKGWSSMFKEKPTMLVKAAGAAEKAARLIKGETETETEN
jgi:antirestriction protein ArdC